MKRNINPEPYCHVKPRITVHDADISQRYFIERNCYGRRLPCFRKNSLRDLFQRGTEVAASRGFFGDTKYEVKLKKGLLS
jgi:hypothetical protein